MTHSLAHDFGSRQITVNCVAPGAIKTDMFYQNARKYVPGGENMTFEQMETVIGQHCPLGRSGCAEDVAGVVALLSSDEAQWITGQTIHCTGGSYMS
jgi:NAD(P)-dependent dehydrogenase (short-subunit alcohol dehydrogenase family)